MFSQLSKARQNQITALLPMEIEEIQSQLCIVSPDLVAALGTSGERLSLATICLRDSANIATDCVGELTAGFASLFWFRQDAPNAPVKYQDVASAKHHADNAALRLYPSAESLAAFAMEFLSIEQKELAPYAKQYTSRVATMGRYLLDKRPADAITAAVSDLWDTDSWKKATKYRNDWVHDQPPLVDGLGFQYQRKARWTEKNGRSYLGVGGGDKGDWTIDELLDTLKEASEALVRCMGEFRDILIAELSEKGMEIDFQTDEVTSKLFP